MANGGGDSSERSEPQPTTHESLARLDREWMMEREQYMVANRYGRRYVPTPAASVVAGAAAIGFGTVWTVTAFKMDAQVGGGIQPFAALGVLLIVLGLFVSITTYRKARRYQVAYDEYRRRRRELLEDGEESE
jgi:hypothetical protein